MEILMDPSIWAGLLTLVVLEIVLGIDNLVFIAILADKLPPKQRDKARIIGLSLALVMRLGLLSVISWMVTLTTPLFSVAEFSFSGRDLILLFGGVFLLFKATMELHERLEGNTHQEGTNRGYAKFWAVVVQIVILDAVFSLDAVITAVGMVNDLPIMMAAVVIAMAVMLLASKPLTQFMNAHPTIVVLCLSFLLMIGLSLIAEGFGLHIPKGYLYAAIGFSILIELFNQIARRNFIKHEARRPMRERTAEAIMRLMGQQGTPRQRDEDTSARKVKETFAEEERYMISGVLTLASRTLRSVMTPRTEISWVDCERSRDAVREQLLDTPHSLFPVCRDELDEIIGVVRAKDLLVALDQGVDIAEFAARTPPIVVPETMDVIKLLAVLRRAKGRLVVVTNEFGVVQGLVTPLDVLEAIAGEFPDEDETPDIITEGDRWLVKGGADLHSLEQALDCDDLVSPTEDYASLAGFLLSHSGQMPAVGDVVELNHLRFEILEISDYRIELVSITKMMAPHEQDA
ncbi:putative tellurium resistance membrane protein TerC [Serratia fonticola]|uniref:Putative tellurium resistance membrane protein TerC n=1 Tax=Serratia fonticola TaxID=47917 RepID=A0A542BQW5_SERFO|nr:TerC family protein [Serratia fonticola]TQI80974.1 putative tellurium resistance membrane protein TerC [Serratia fonticola]TQI97002.1 putative tellurium resistance membrane protein TerC [Serratia fonticola]TVZ71497.1 putative tellurium resistance membrane protein TerC [Serratia fonticola]